MKLLDKILKRLGYVKAPDEQPEIKKETPEPLMITASIIHDEGCTVRTDRITKINVNNRIELEKKACDAVLEKIRHHVLIWLDKFEDYGDDVYQGFRPRANALISIIPRENCQRKNPSEKSDVIYSVGSNPILYDNDFIERQHETTRQIPQTPRLRQSAEELTATHV